MRKLPSHIIKQIDDLIVDRQGDKLNSHMKTTKIFNYVAPNLNYKITNDNLNITNNNLTKKDIREKIPNFTKLSGVWKNDICSNNDTNNKNRNILGKDGVLLIDTQNVSLKIKTQIANDHVLKYYNAKLFKIGDTITFDTNIELPICTMNIGENYYSSYIMNKNLGGGFYLEYHDRPHFHLPLDKEAKGHLILGKKINDVYHLTAFKIPYGYGIYTPPNVIHNDLMLIGNYLVIYSITKNFSTVICKNKQSELINFTLV
jgi:hypothetical protein